MSEILNTDNTSDDDWHVSASLRRAWAAGSAPDEQAWSIEAHLLACRRCREDVAADVAGSPVEALADGVRATLADLPPQGRVRPASRTRQVGLLLGLRQAGLAWLLVSATLLAGAATLDLLAQADLGGSWVAAVAPLLPVLGVALAWGPGLDPAHEIAAATPVAGLRLVLWRTAGVLLGSLPAALAIQVLVAALHPASSGGLELVGWLLPALGLTLAALAAGSLVGTAAASAGIAALWFGGAVAPLAAGAAPLLLSAVPPPGWAAGALVSLAVLAIRKDHLDRLLAPPSLGGPA